MPMHALLMMQTTQEAFTYKHNNVDSLEKNLNVPLRWQANWWWILVISEGVFGMREAGRLKEIVELKINSILDYL